MKMTLEQVRDWLKNCSVSCTESSNIRNSFLGEMADAIDAHLAGMREPVAEVCNYFDLRWVGNDPISSIIKRNGIKIGDKLYIAPPIDLATVHELITDLREWGDGIALTHFADKLEAAIKGVAKQ